MTLLTWNHACSVGVRAMDDQHGILMDAINALRLALVRGAGRERIRELLDEFIEFARMHFWSEEQLMGQTGFAGLEEHRAEHHRMLADILQAAHRLQYGKGVQLRPLLCSLHHGFLNHIETMDQKYVPWLHEHGVF
ncbi:MAG TPA: hemerythrin family protein [Terracidiphilus sp.]|nr:hemerythrin family protein [Terracidiphilus sp.]